MWSKLVDLLKSPILPNDEEKKLRTRALNALHPGTRIFFVRDNGMGIAPEYHERIFGLFDKLDTSSEGTGIGLALVKRIIEFHGGRIWVESIVGSGSTFYFTLQSPVHM